MFSFFNFKARTLKVSKFNYLGTILDEQLMWKEHVDMVCSKVNKRLGLLSKAVARLKI